MVQYLAKRIGRSVLTLFIIVTLVFCLLRLMPVEGYLQTTKKCPRHRSRPGCRPWGF